MFHGLILYTFIDVDRIILYYALWAHVRCVCVHVCVYVFVGVMEAMKNTLNDEKDAE